MRSVPTPVSWICRSSSGGLMISASVGSRGRERASRAGRPGSSGSSSSATAAATSSRRLCGGMSVARPTAMPEAPLSSTCGSRDGSTSGSSRVPSKLGTQSTVPCGSSESSVCANARQPRLGVAHGGERARVVLRSPVALAVDQRVAEAERLRHQHHRLVAGGVAVRMELAQHVAHRARRLLVLGGGREAQLRHRVDDPPLHRLEPVGERRQRAVEHHVHRVVEVRLLGEDARGRAARRRGSAAAGAMRRRPLPRARALGMAARMVAVRSGRAADPAGGG